MKFKSLFLFLSVMLENLKKDVKGAVDLGVIITIGIVFAGLMVIAFIIWTLNTQLLPSAPSATTTTVYNDTYRSIGNVTGGFDDFVNLILIVITVFILALAIAALYMIYNKRN